MIPTCREFKGHSKTALNLNFGILLWRKTFIYSRMFIYRLVIYRHFAYIDIFFLIWLVLGLFTLKLFLYIDNDIFIYRHVLVGPFTLFYMIKNVYISTFFFLFFFIELPLNYYLLLFLRILLYLLIRQQYKEQRFSCSFIF